MSLDQKRARWFGVLYLITFVTSISALALYETVLRHPERYIAGTGHDTQVLLGALLELLLIIANIGTAVVIFPIVRRQNEELALGYVTARLFECMFILVGILCMLGIITLRNQVAGPSEGTVAYTLAAIKDCDFPPRPGLGRRLGERTDPRLSDVPHGPRTATGSVARARRRTADHRVRDGRDVHRQPTE